MRILPLLLALSASVAFADDSARLVGSARAETKATNPSGLDADYKKKMGQPTVCGNRPYLARVADNYRDACDQTARTIQATIRRGGMKCDHVAMVAPAIKGTHVSEVLCVVRGGDVVYGLTTNTINYVVTPTEIKRLPTNAQESRAAVDSAVSRAMEADPKTRAVYLVKAWKLYRNQEQPNIVQVIPVESQRICDMLLDDGDSSFGSFGPAEMFCMVKRPVMPPEWQCEGNINTDSSENYTCNAM